LTPLKEIEAFFETYEYSNSPIEISPGESSSNLKKMVQTHLKTLKANPKNSRFMPFYTRLLLIYKLLKN